MATNAPPGASIGPPEDWGQGGRKEEGRRDCQRRRRSGPPTRRAAFAASTESANVGSDGTLIFPHILKTLRQFNWVIAGRNGAASRLGLPRTTLIYRMRKLGIKAERIDALGNAVAEPSPDTSAAERCPSFAIRALQSIQSPKII